jgi:hypothetical protein
MITSELGIELNNECQRNSRHPLFFCLRAHESRRDGGIEKSGRCTGNACRGEVALTSLNQQDQGLAEAGLQRGIPNDACMANTVIAVVISMSPLHIHFWFNHSGTKTGVQPAMAAPWGESR